MSKPSRRLFASLRRFAVASFCCATLVGFVGCAGGSNPFCCDSKEKSQIDQNLERAQSLDEREKDAETTESQEQDGAKEEAPLHANILRSDGSGDATQIADATTPKTFATESQPPVTVSTTAAAQEASALAADSAGLLQAPVLPSTAQTSQTPQAAPSTSADLATTNENKPEVANETAAANAANAAPTSVDATSEAAQTPSESQEAQDKQNTQETTTENVDDANETQEEKAATIHAYRSPRRDGPQRAATRQIAQRAAAKPPVAVPQTRAAATLSAPTPVVTFRTQTVVPGAAPSADPTPVVTFRTRIVVP